MLYSCDMRLSLRRLLRGLSRRGRLRRLLAGLCRDGRRRDRRWLRGGLLGLLLLNLLLSLLACSGCGRRRRGLGGRVRHLALGRAGRGVGRLRLLERGLELAGVWRARSRSDQRGRAAGMCAHSRRSRSGSRASRTSAGSRSSRPRPSRPTSGRCQCSAAASCPRRLRDRVSAPPSPHRDRARRTEVVCADLEGLITSHDEADLSRAGVLEQLDVARPTFLPLGRGRVKAEELSAPTKWSAYHVHIRAS
jgi:hypothetical protein